MKSVPDFRIALWVENLAAPLENLEMWVSRIEAQMCTAKQGGASVFVIPEYGCIHWLQYMPNNLPVGGQLPWLATQTVTAVAALQKVVNATGLSLVAGSFPVPVAAHEIDHSLFLHPSDKRTDKNAPRFFNRAFVLKPNEPAIFQDKMSLTPWELDEKCWNIEAGRKIEVFEICGVRCAVVICLDIQQPLLAVELLKQDVDVVLVPSMTGLPSGYARVFDCAKARAIELYAAVAVCGAVGAPDTLPNETNYSGAALFLPCETAYGTDGLAAKVDPSYTAPDNTHPGIVLMTPAVPVANMREKRIAHQAETWTGGLKHRP